MVQSYLHLFLLRSSKTNENTVIFLQSKMFKYFTAMGTCCLGLSLKSYLHLFLFVQKLGRDGSFQHCPLQYRRMLSRSHLCQNHNCVSFLLTTGAYYLARTCARIIMTSLSSITTCCKLTIISRLHLGQNHICISFYTIRNLNTSFSLTQKVNILTMEACCLACTCVKINFYILTLLFYKLRCEHVVSFAHSVVVVILTQSLLLDIPNSKPSLSRWEHVVSLARVLESQRRLLPPLEGVSLDRRVGRTGARCKRHACSTYVRCCVV